MSLIMSFTFYIISYYVVLMLSAIIVMTSFNVIGQSLARRNLYLQL